MSFKKEGVSSEFKSIQYLDKKYPYNLPAPNQILTAEKFGVFKYEKNIGELGLRGNNLKNKIGLDQRIVFALGCSYTNGSGVNDDQTFPYYLEQLSKNKYQVLNFGVPGGGLQDAIPILFDSDRFLKKAGKNISDPIFIYTYFNSHISRFSRIGLNLIYETGNVFPRKSNGRFEITNVNPKGSIRRGFIILGDYAEPAIYSLILKSFDYLDKNIFMTKSRKDLIVDNYLQGLTFFIQEFYKKFPKGKMILVSLYPEEELDQKISKIDNRILLIKIDPDLEKISTIPNDGHFTPEGNKIIAKILVDNMQKFGF